MTSFGGTVRGADTVSAAVVPGGREKQGSVSLEAIIQGIGFGALSPLEGGRKPRVKRWGFRRAPGRKLGV